MKVIQIVAGIGIEAAGPGYSVPRLAESLLSVGADVELDVLYLPPNRTFDCKVVTHQLDMSLFLTMGFSKSMRNYLNNKSKEIDVIQTNGLWMMPNVYPSWAVSGTNCKLVMAPRGCLAKWSLNKGRIKKFIFGTLLQYPALRSAHMFHATSVKEYEEIRTFGLKQPVAIVPIGMDLPNVVRPKRNPGDMHTLAFFGRIHKVKSVDLMVRAWGRVADCFPDWRVVIAGPDCGDLKRIEDIIAEADIQRVEFVGGLNGKEKYEFLSSVDVYCLPSETENFGVTLAEALACGTPSIASKGTPWKGLEENGCGYWVDHSVEALSLAFEKMMKLSDDERDKMGMHGREWIMRDFSWKSIGEKMLRAYEWLCDPALEKPEFVVLD